MRMVVLSAVLYGCRYQLNASAKDCMPTLISHASKFVAIASQVRKLTAQADAQVKTAAQRVVMPPVQNKYLPLPAVMDEHQLELSLFFTQVRLVRSRRTGQARRFTQCLPDCLLHSLYRCCRS